MPGEDENKQRPRHEVADSGHGNIASSSKEHRNPLVLPVEQNRPSPSKEQQEAESRQEAHKHLSRPPLHPGPTPTDGLDKSRRRLSANSPSVINYSDPTGHSLPIDNSIRFVHAGTPVMSGRNSSKASRGSLPMSWRNESKSFLPHTKSFLQSCQSRRTLGGVRHRRGPSIGSIGADENCAEIPSQIYRLDIDKAAVANLEMEKYLAIDPRRNIVGKMWRGTLGSGQCTWNNQVWLTKPTLADLIPTPPDKEKSIEDTSQTKLDIKTSDNSKGKKDKDKSNSPEGSWPIGPVSIIVSFLVFPKYTARRSSFCRKFCSACCLGTRDSDSALHASDVNQEDDNEATAIEGEGSMSSGASSLKENGFDYHFEKFVSGTKRREWPLRIGSPETLDNASMHTISRHFWWFLYIRSTSDTAKAVGFCILRGICSGFFPLIQGYLVSALTDGTSAITEINEGIISGDPTKERNTAQLKLGIWLGIYAAVFGMDHVFEWYFGYFVPEAGWVRRFRFALFGRMLKLKENLNEIFG